MMAGHHRFAWRTWTDDQEYRLFKGSGEYAVIRRERDHHPCMSPWWEVLIDGSRVTRHPDLRATKKLGIEKVKERLASAAPEPKHGCRGMFIRTLGR